MVIELTCPRCGESVETQERQCPICGGDMALAEVLAAERAASASLSVTVPAGTPMAPEILVPRLGDYLLERGVVTAEDLQRASNYHQKLVEGGQERLFGQVLLELGMVDRETLDQVITEQILKLQSVLQQANHQLEHRVQERTQELQRALSKLSELSQLKSNFISNISHELRTPLTHIRGYLGLLAEGGLGQLTQAQIDAFDVLLRAEARLERLIEDLIQFSLATRGELTLNIALADVKGIICSAVDKAETLALTRKIQVDTEIPDQLPLVRVDGEKISWVLLQLLDNAIKFTSTGGHVTVSATLEGKLMNVAVSDNGIGIARERFHELFEPFHQLDGSDTRRYGGVGLGLAMVRHIIEAHGSIISVESEPGKGTRFEFPLPLANERYA
jgi:signal transduction histidine kinase